MNTILFILHLLGFGAGFAVATGNSLAMILAAKAPPEEAVGLRRFPPIMARVGDVGLALLWITGLIMLWTKYGGPTGIAALPNPEAFWAKIICVVLLTGLNGLMRATAARIQRGDMSVAARMPIFGRIGAVLLLLVVIFAVMAFD
jgi:hypothetical protein